MGITERAIGARILGVLTEDEAADLATIDQTVIYRIFDPYGTILDSRTAVLFKVEHEGRQAEIVVAGKNEATATLGFERANFDSVTVVRAADLVAKL